MTRWLYQGEASPPLTALGEVEEVLCECPEMNQPIPRKPLTLQLASVFQEPPAESPVTFEWYESPHRVPAISQRRPLNLPLHDTQPLFTGPERMRVDWETPFSLPVFKLPPKPIEQFFFLEDQEERVERASWDVPFSQPTFPELRIILGEYGDLFLDDYEEEVAPFVDKWDSPVMRLVPVRPPRQIQPWPFEPTDEPPLPDDLYPDHWWTRLSEPVRLPPWLLPRFDFMDPEPIPDTPLLPTRIPWDTPLPMPIWPVPNRVMTSRENWTNLITEELVSVESWETPLTRLDPWRPKMPIALFPFRNEVEDEEPEDVTLDKWWTPLAYNFRKLPPAPLPEFEERGQPPIQEDITLDKYYSPTTAYPEYTHRALRAVTDPQPQSRYWTVITAPWIRFQSMDPQPIPDIPGVTDAWWFTSLAIPIELFTQHEENDNQYLRLYLPLQNFPIDERIFPCENPRRRVSERRGSCGANV